MGLTTALIGTYTLKVIGNQHECFKYKPHSEGND